MTDVLNMLLEADKLLDEIAVRGNDVFLLSSARKIMKSAFDRLSEPPKEVEVSEVDGR